MENNAAGEQFFGQEKIPRILLRIAPPVMLAQLIQALYNIVDSLFVGRYAESGLTALSIIYPIQLLMVALAVGTGVGINTAMAARFGVGKRRSADAFAGVGTPLAALLWLIFAAVCWCIMPTYARLSTTPPEVVEDVIVYGRIVCVFSFGLFFESIWTKVLQANGDMKTPMVAQILGAVTNIILDPLLIFGLLGLPRMGIAGAAVATVAGQVVAIGRVGFRFIGISFLPMVTSLVFPVFFQAVGAALKSSLLTVVRTVVLFVPLGMLFSRFGLTWFWLTFPVTETLTSLLGVWYYRQFLDHPYVHNAPLADRSHPAAVLRASRPGVIVTIAREHGSSGKEIGRRLAQRLGIPFYYKEMTALAAQESGLDREFVSAINRNAPRILYSLYLSTRVVRLAVIAQHRIIEKIADQGSCVIVGRAADYVLRDRENLFRVFVRAPEPYRISRVMEVYGDTPEEARDNIRRSDRARAAYYRHISGRRWGAAEQYDLVLDSSCGVQQAVEQLLAALGARNPVPSEQAGSRPS